MDLIVRPAKGAATADAVGTGPGASSAAVAPTDRHPAGNVAASTPGGPDKAATPAPADLVAGQTEGATRWV